MNITSKKNCYCHTCNKYFHYLGIARHRAMHRDKNEDCKITFTDGNTSIFKFSNNNCNHPNEYICDFGTAQKCTKCGLFI